MTQLSTQVFLDDPALTRRSPGEEFARAVTTATAGRVAAEAAELEVTLRVSLPTTFPLAKTRPRYTVRHLLKTATVVERSARYVREERGGAGSSGTTYDSTPEAGFSAELAEAKLTELTARIPVPAGLTADPALLAAFTDHRLVVRLCTVENEALLHGTADGAIAGLLNADGLRQARGTGDLTQDIARAAADVEEMGGSCDGIVTHPAVYWSLVTSGLLGRLAETGLRVSRTRMIQRDALLFGDFRAVATLLDANTSVLRLRRAGDQTVLEATVHTGLAVHLPQHLLLLRV